MRQAESLNEDWDDEQLDELLTDFFRAQIPPPLRHEPAPTPARTTRAASSSAGGLRFVALAVVALCLVIVVSAIDGPDAPPPLTRSTLPPPAVVPALVEESLPEADLQFVMESEERYVTDDGPVEQRTNLRWSQVSIPTRDSSQPAEVMLPELQIDVFPIEEEEPSEKLQR